MKWLLGIAVLAIGFFISIERIGGNGDSQFFGLNRFIVGTNWNPVSRLIDTKHISNKLDFVASLRRSKFIIDASCDQQNHVGLADTGRKNIGSKQAASLAFFDCSLETFIEVGLLHCENRPLLRFIAICPNSEAFTLSFSGGFSSLSTCNRLFRTWIPTVFCSALREKIYGIMGIFNSCFANIFEKEFYTHPRAVIENKWGGSFGLLNRKLRTLIINKYSTGCDYCVRLVSLNLNDGVRLLRSLLHFKQLILHHLQLAVENYVVSYADPNRCCGGYSNPNSRNGSPARRPISGGLLCLAGAALMVLAFRIGDTPANQIGYRIFTWGCGLCAAFLIAQGTVLALIGIWFYEIWTKYPPV